MLQLSNIIQLNIVVLFMWQLISLRAIFATPIVGGIIIDHSEIFNYPFIVSLQELKAIKNDINYEFSHICGGILISSEWILTAAHCVHEKFTKNLSVVIGEEKLNKSNLIRYSVTRLELFYFNPYTNRNDIALLQFKNDRKIKFRSLQLPPNGMAPNKNVSCKILGYGAKIFAGPIQNSLRLGKVKLINNKECLSILGNIMGPKDGDNTVCAIGKGQDSCQGDSGGPLICTYTNNQEYLFGIVSQGLQCGGIPSIYTTIKKYLNWIESIIK